MNPRLGLAAVLIVVVAFSATYGPYGLAVAGDPGPTATETQTPYPADAGLGTDTPTVAPTPVETPTEALTTLRPTTAPESLTRWPPGNNPVGFGTLTDTTPVYDRTPACDEPVTEYYEFVTHGERLEGNRYLTPKDCDTPTTTATQTPTPTPTLTPIDGTEGVRINAASCERVVVDPSDDVDSIVVGVYDQEASAPDIAHHQFVIYDVSGRVVITPQSETYDVITGVWLYQGERYNASQGGEAEEIVGVELPCGPPDVPPSTMR